MEATAVTSSRHVRMGTQEVVQALAAALGAPIVAVMAGVKDTRSVRFWIAGEKLPRGAVDDRLRLALQTLDIILTRNERDVARAWFAGMEPELDDQAPAIVIAERDDPASRRAVLAAARRFIAEQ